MAKIKNLDDLLAEQAVRKAVSCYSRGAVRCDIDILKSLFPGGSITGAPKEIAMSIIDKLEKYNRGIYTGTMGYIKPNGDILILGDQIRDKLINNGIALIGINKENI